MDYFRVEYQQEIVKMREGVTKDNTAVGKDNLVLKV